MRLLLVIDSLGSGGAQRQMVTLALALAARGHTPVFLVYYPEHEYFADELARAGIEVQHVEKGSRFSLGPALAIRRTLRAEPFDAVLAYLPTPSVYAELATRFLGHPPLVVSERSAFEEDPPRRSFRLRGQLHRLATLVVTNSHHHREAMARHFPWLATRLRTIWNGVDAERFAPLPVSARRDDALLAVGSIRPWKNARGLAEALIVLQERGVAVPRVRWVGKLEPHEASRRERDTVNSRLAAAGLADRWEWVGEHEDVPALLRAHAALVHPSLLEGLPNAVCEALASGLPVLAGAVGDQPRLVEDGTTGLLFDPADPSSIADAIQRFGRFDGAARAAMSAAARRFAEERLSVSRVCDEYETLLRPLVAEHRRRRGAPLSVATPPAGDHYSVSETR
jgi:glycosyltransferase involved in cell wall biosynthesis